MEKRGEEERCAYYVSINRATHILQNIFGKMKITFDNTIDKDLNSKDLGINKKCQEIVLYYFPCGYYIKLPQTWCLKTIEILFLQF